MNLLELAAEDEMKAKLLFASSPPTHNQIVGDFWEQDVWQPLCPDLSAPSIVHQMFIFFRGKQFVNSEHQATLLKQHWKVL